MDFARQQEGVNLISKGPDAPVRETLLSQLSTAADCLAMCEELLCTIRAKIAGTDQAKTNESRQQSGVNGQAMEVMSRAQRIRSELQDLNGYLA